MNTLTLTDSAGIAGTLTLDGGKFAFDGDPRRAAEAFLAFVGHPAAAQMMRDKGHAPTYRHNGTCCPECWALANVNGTKGLVRQMVCPDCGHRFQAVGKAERRYARMERPR